MRDAERAVAATGKAKGKGKSQRTQAHGAQNRATDHGTREKSRAQEELRAAKVERERCAVGLQMEEIDFLFSMSAMVSLHCAMQRDNPQNMPNWWWENNCIVCSDNIASICHELSSVMHKHIGG